MVLMLQCKAGVGVTSTGRLSVFTEQPWHADNRE